MRGVIFMCAMILPSSRSPSIQSSAARVTTVDWRCVSPRIKTVRRDKNVDSIDTLQYAPSPAERDAQIHWSILAEARN